MSQNIEIASVEVWVEHGDCSDLEKVIENSLKDGWHIIYQTAFNRTDRQGEGYSDKHYTVHVIVFQKG